MNEFITRVLQAATDPSFDQDPAAQVRERLRLAGLLAEELPAADSAPDSEAVAAARKALATGVALSDIVIGDR